MGNSEVGHLNLGAGRVVYQEFTRVSRSIKTGSFFTNLTLTDAVDETIKELGLSNEVSIIISLDESKDVRMMLSDLENGIGTSLILVLLVIFVGLGARNAILVALAIPFSMKGRRSCQRAIADW